MKRTVWPAEQGTFSDVGLEDWHYPWTDGNGRASRISKFLNYTKDGHYYVAVLYSWVTGNYQEHTFTSLEEAKRFVEDAFAEHGVKILPNHLKVLK